MKYIERVHAHKQKAVNDDEIIEWIYFHREINQKTDTNLLFNKIEINNKFYIIIIYW